MKFSVDAEVLAEAIALCDRAIPKRPSRPILGHMLMQLDNGSLILKGFDEALGISFSLPVDMEQSGDCCISPTYLKPILERLSGRGVALDLQYPVLVLTTLGGEYRINTLLAEDYPNLPEVDGTPVELSISSEELRAAIAATVFCASTDESKQVLTGVHFSVTPDEEGEAGVMELAATDGHRLIAYPLPGSVVIPDDYRPVTLPGKSLRELLTVLKGYEGTVKLQFDETSARILCGDTELYSRVLEGQYPNYRQLFPKVFAKIATCDRKPFLAALDRTLVVAGENQDIVKLEFVAAGLVMSAEAQGAAKAQEHVEGVTCSEPITLAGNGKYIKEALTNAILGEVFTVEMNEPTKPVVFTDGSPATYLVMPIQIRD